MHEPWISANSVGMGIGLCGAGLLLVSTFFGLLSHRLARLGLARRWVLGGFALLTLCGAAACVAGTLGWYCHQPAYLWCTSLALAVAILGSVLLGMAGINDRYRRASDRAHLQALANQLLPGTSSRILARSMPPRRR
jgi:hypothetical protein